MLTLRLDPGQLIKRPMPDLAKSKENSTKRHKNSIILVFQWAKTTLILYKIGGSLSIEVSNVPSSNLHLIPFPNHLFQLHVVVHLLIRHPRMTL